MQTGLPQQRLVAVFLVAVLLFNYPVLAIFDHAGTVFGIPLLFLLLFAGWAGVIAAITWIVERGSH